MCLVCVCTVKTRAHHSFFQKHLYKNLVYVCIQQNDVHIYPYVQLAEYHLRRALSINPNNSVLHCYLGIVLLSARQYEDALPVLQVIHDILSFCLLEKKMS